jgi:hypothetical protein
MPALTIRGSDGGKIWKEAECFQVSRQLVILRSSGGKSRRLPYFTDALEHGRKYASEPERKPGQFQLDPRFKSLEGEDWLKISLDGQEINRRGCDHTATLCWHHDCLWLEDEQGQSLAVLEDGLWRDGVGLTGEVLEVRGESWQPLGPAASRRERPSALAERATSSPNPASEETGPDLSRFVLLCHVPRSQVWAGSRGAQRGNTHLHVRDERFDAGRIHRLRGQALCGKRGWYERPVEFPSEFTDLCPRCSEIASRPS